jgi:hypothetical protein
MEIEELRNRIETIIPLDTLLNILTYVAVIAVGGIFLITQI